MEGGRQESGKKSLILSYYLKDFFGEVIKVIFMNFSSSNQVVFLSGIHENLA